MATAQAPAPELEAPGSSASGAGRRQGFRTFLKRLFREQKLGAAGAIVVLLFLLVGIFAEVLATHDIYTQDHHNELQGPSVQYPLGTDQFGRDLLSRVIRGARVSLIVGLGAAVLQVVIASSIGLLSGCVGGWVDTAIQRFVDAVMTLPGLFVILTLMTLLPRGIFTVILVLGAHWGIVNIRTMRSVVLSVKENAYVEAARAVGARTRRVLLRHILPQMVAPIIVLFSISVGGNIIGEATIGFLGFGVPPPNPTWGGMLSREAYRYMLQNPWIAVWPGLALAVVMFGTNMFGDALRDLLDPKLRGGIGRFAVPMKQRRAARG